MDSSVVYDCERRGENFLALHGSSLYAVGLHDPQVHCVFSNVPPLRTPPNGTSEINKSRGHRRRTNHVGFVNPLAAIGVLS